MPNRKITDIERTKRGTDKPYRMVGETLEFDELPDSLPAPDFLNVWGKKYWDRIVPILQHRGVLTVVDVEGLEVLCMVYGMIRAHAVAGVDVNASLVTQLRLYQREYGLTINSRVSIKDDRKGNNPFNTNGRKKPEISENRAKR